MVKKNHSHNIHGTGIFTQGQRVRSPRDGARARMTLSKEKIPQDPWDKRYIFLHECLGFNGKCSVW